MKRRLLLIALLLFLFLSFFWVNRSFYSKQPANPATAHVAQKETSQSLKEQVQDPAHAVNGKIRVEKQVKQSKSVITKQKFSVSIDESEPTEGEEYSKYKKGKRPERGEENESEFELEENEGEGENDEYDGPHMAALMEFQ
ncbi:MAG: hypothetical protein JST02_09555, partial [Bacteroidetes bacterium]|nr:hypothetical protein [Bacteroidota bacterium]